MSKNRVLYLRPDFQAHGDCGRMPARGGKTRKGRVFRRDLIKMKRLGIELGGKLLDLFTRDPPISAFEPHAERQIIEPTNHDRPRNGF
jgi:hypothetical protein